MRTKPVADYSRSQPVTTPRRGRVVEIVPQHKYMDGIIERIAAEVVYVEDDTSERHCFVTGSMNGIPAAKVGQEGQLDWVTSRSFHIWFFKPDKEL